MYDRVRDSYDRVAERYAEEISGELAGKPVDKALLRCLADLVSTVEDAVEGAVEDAVEVATGPGAVADLGCGPGHIAAYLSARGVATIGVDLSPAMIEAGRGRFPDVTFRLGSLLALPITDGEVAAAIAFYSILHLRPDDRPTAYKEMARVVRAGGWLLVAFHLGLVGHEPGGIMHADEWWGQQVDLDFYYLDPGEVVTGLAAAGFVLMSRTDREPWPGVELQTRRCYLLLRRS